MAPTLTPVDTQLSHIDPTGLDHTAVTGTYEIAYSNEDGESQSRYTNVKRIALAYVHTVETDSPTGARVYRTSDDADEPSTLIYPTASMLARIAQGETATMTRATLETIRASETVAIVSPTVGILAALDRAYIAIRLSNPDVPSAIALTLAPSKKARGHFQAGSWEDTGKLGTRHELNIGAERLQDGALATFATLLHECAHALAQATGQKDTSRQGRFHNGTFATIASAMGCVVESDDKIGHVTGDTLQSWAEILYADAIAELDTALSTFKPRGNAAAKAAKTTCRIGCACGELVTVPIKWFDNFGAASLNCVICEEYYSIA
jgi:hypothetical protein